MTNELPIATRFVNLIHPEEVAYFELLTMRATLQTQDTTYHNESATSHFVQMLVYMRVVCVVYLYPF